MKRSVLVCVCCVAASSLLAIPAEADHGFRKRSFFEVLFGVNPKPRKPAVTIQEPWAEDDVRIVREPRARKKARKVARIVPGVVDKPVAKMKKLAPVVAAAFVDPETAAGFGMGNLVYVPTAFVAVNDRSIARTPTGDIATDSIRLTLADRQTAIRASASVRKLVVEHYKATEFKPLWIKDGALTARGLQVLDVLKSSADDGLIAQQFLPPVLAGFDAVDSQIAGSAMAQAQLDVGLTVATVTFAQHIFGGAFDPALLSQYHDVKPETVDGAKALKLLTYSPFPAEYLRGLAPTHPAYLALKAELAQVDGKKVVVQGFPAGPRVKQGQKDPRIIELRAVLAREGLLQPVEVTDKNRSKLEYLDKPLAKVLKAYQKSRDIKETGQLDEATVGVLGGPSRVGSRDLIAINMERLRWLPKQLGQRHVLVNQAAQRLELVENGKQIWTTKVVVGKPLTQTNVFSDTFDDIVVNPSWTMPQGIFLRDYLSKSRSNASYIDKKGYEVFDKNGKVVKSRNVNWNTVGANSPYRITQPPGPANALGTLKFNFPNRHAIYLHDTPDKELFAEDVRTFSNGCVRVENPAELAQALLGIDAAALDSLVGTGATKSVKVKSPTRVHLYYFTAWPAEDGSIAYFPDPYERDKALLDALIVAKNATVVQKKQQLVEIN